MSWTADHVAYTELTPDTCHQTDEAKTGEGIAAEGTPSGTDGSVER